MTGSRLFLAITSLFIFFANGSALAQEAHLWTPEQKEEAAKTLDTFVHEGVTYNVPHFPLTARGNLDTRTIGRFEKLTMEEQQAFLQRRNEQIEKFLSTVTQYDLFGFLKSEKDVERSVSEDDLEKLSEQNRISVTILKPPVEKWLSLLNNTYWKTAGQMVHGKKRGFGASLTLSIGGLFRQTGQYKVFGIGVNFVRDPRRGKYRLYFYQHLETKHPTGRVNLMFGSKLNFNGYMIQFTDQIFKTDEMRHQEGDSYQFATGPKFMQSHDISYKGAGVGANVLGFAAGALASWIVGDPNGTAAWVCGAACTIINTMAYANVVSSTFEQKPLMEVDVESRFIEPSRRAFVKLMKIYNKALEKASALFSSASCKSKFAQILKVDQ